jgi:predicted transcriptional regulator
MEEALVPIRATVNETPGLRCSEIAEIVALDRVRCGKLLVRLRQEGKIRAEGERASTVYFPA